MLTISSAVVAGPWRDVLQDRATVALLSGTVKDVPLDTSYG